MVCSGSSGMRDVQVSFILYRTDLPVGTGHTCNEAVTSPSPVPVSQNSDLVQSPTPVLVYSVPTAQTLSNDLTP